MRTRFIAAVIAFSLSVGAALADTAAPSYASLAATTGSATSITSSSAILNGVALTLHPTSAWRFAYGPTTAYGKWSNGAAVGLGLTALSATVSDLAPSTTYHFRLVVVQGNPGLAGDWSFGDDVAFTTRPAPPPPSPYGTASLRSHQLAAKHGIVSIPFRCRGTHEMVCRGSVWWQIHNARGEAVICGTATLAATGGTDRTVTSAIAARCMRLLRKSPSHTLTAELSAGLAGAQKFLGAVVTVSA